MGIRNVLWAIGRPFCEHDDRALFNLIKTLQSEVHVLRAESKETHRILELQSVVLHDTQMHQAECAAAQTKMHERLNYLAEERDTLVRTLLEQRSENQSPSGGHSYLKAVDG